MCKPWQFDCIAGQQVQGAISDGFEKLGKLVVEAFNKGAGAFATTWVDVGTPAVANPGATQDVRQPPDRVSESLGELLGNVQWISLVLAVLLLIGLGALMAMRARAGDGFMAIGSVGWVLVGAIVVTAAPSLVLSLTPDAVQNAGGAVAYLQSSLFVVTIALATAGVVIGAVQLMIEQRGESVRRILQGLLTFLLVAGSGVILLNLLIRASDAFSVWILDGSLDCSIHADSCFDKNFALLIALTASAGGPLGTLLLIILGGFAVLVLIFQIAMVFARSAFLVLMAGILPVSAAATATATGGAFFKQTLSWTVAFVLYKPAAAIVYATAFHLVGSDALVGDVSGLMKIIMGLSLMILSLMALPALKAMVTPPIAAAGGGSGGAMFAAAGVGAVAAGAAGVAGHLGSGSGGADSAPPGPADGSGNDGSGPASEAPTGGGSGGAGGSTGDGDLGGGSADTADSPASGPGSSSGDAQVDASSSVTHIGGAGGGTAGSSSGPGPAGSDGESGSSGAHGDIGEKGVHAGPGAEGARGGSAASGAGSSSAAAQGAGAGVAGAGAGAGAGAAATGAATGGGSVALEGARQAATGATRLAETGAQEASDQIGDNDQNGDTPDGSKQ